MLGDWVSTRATGHPENSDMVNYFHLALVLTLTSITLKLGV